MKQIISLLMLSAVALFAQEQKVVGQTQKEKVLGKENMEEVKKNAVFVNDICLPSTLYMLENTQNDIFVQAILKRWRPYNDFVRFEASKGQTFMRRLSEVASIQNPVEGAVLKTDLVNGDEFETIKTLQSTIHVGKAGVGEKTVTVQVLGDSLTNGGFFKDAMMSAVPHVRFVGLRRFMEGQYDEGRGGWRLGSYFNVPTGEVYSYHGYMQPDGEWRYWGARKFWLNAWQVYRKTAPNGFEPRYSCGRYETCLPRFEESTGILLNPQKGDLQYDNDAKAFVGYDGNVWKTVSDKELKWNFDYSKYLEMWKLEKPDFLFVALGVNDYCNAALDVDFSPWEQMITIVKDSYLKANPEGKFVLCTPLSTCGDIDNAAGTFTLRQNASLWRFREWMIRTFDRREKDGFYLVEMGALADPVHGFNLASESPVTLPFAGYKGAERFQVISGNPHPYQSYHTMGTAMAAFVQYYRK